MNHSAKGPSKVKMGMTAFVILLSGAGAGVYAYVEPNGTTPNVVALDGEWRSPVAADKKEAALSMSPGKSGAMQRETSRRYMMLSHDKKQTEAQASSNTPREPFTSLSDSDKKKLLVLLALWSIKS